MYRANGQGAFERRVSFPVFAQFEPMLELSALDENTADARRITGDVCVNHFSHCSVSFAGQRQCQTRTAFDRIRYFPTVRADRRNGNSLYDLFACSSNPTSCNLCISLCPSSKQLWRRVQQVGVQFVQFLFHRLARFKDFRLSEREIPTLLMAQFCNKLDVFFRLFGRYFCQIFDLRAFRPVLVQLIHFSFSFVLRAFLWPLRGCRFFGAVRALVLDARLLERCSVRFSGSPPCTKRTWPFPSCKSVRTIGKPGNQSLQVFQTDTAL